MMRETQIIMGMPITVEIVDAVAEIMGEVFDYFKTVDQRFSTYKSDSEISLMNDGCLALRDCSSDMHEVLAIAEQTKRETDGYFEIKRPDGLIDPSGIVKGWAIGKAARLIVDSGANDFFIEAGGDIQSHGKSGDGAEWKFGIRNPFHLDEIIKVVTPKGRGMATSGTSVRGQHIYNPHQPEDAIKEIVSLTVIGPDILEADRFATACFAMGNRGIEFIERLPGFEGYLVNRNGIATFTSGFGAYVSS